ncbi:MAG: response regulator [SAR324 cluster bacterium]|nr:response regulator [SAR324 cluster bacterium]
MHSNNIKILIVDDSFDDRKMLKELLDESKDVLYQFAECEEGQQAIELLQNEFFNCLLLDYRLPDMDGLEFVKQIEAGIEILPPLVMLTGQGNERVAVQALKSGFQDYLVKGEITSDSLQKTVNNAIEKSSMANEISRQQLELQEANARLRKTNQKILEEISERKQLEAQLRQAQKMEAIGILTGGIAHEFNNLLSPILGYTELLIGDKASDDPEKESLEQIQIAGNRAKKLVQQMLAYGQQSLSQRESVSLESLVKATLEFVKKTIPRNIVSKTEIEADLPPIRGMPNEIHQVIVNLCLNASQAMPDGGEIAIRLINEGYRKFKNASGQSREGEFIALYVEDTGVGMDQPTLDKIYDPFFTTKKVGFGTGLGLSVVYGIVEQHKGHILVESELGKGTVFKIYFPVSREEAKSPILNACKIDPENFRILLIDDEPIVAKLAKRMLEKLGYFVNDYIDCSEALNFFTEHPQDFELVLTDYEMPQMNGKQLAMKIKEIRPQIPIVLLTGYGDLLLKQDIAKWGMEGMLTKPFEIKELGELVQEILSTNSGADGEIQCL